MGRKERNILFTDTLNIFYLLLYGIGHIVKDHSDSERKPTGARARCSSVVGAFAHDAMGRRIDPSWWTH